MRPDEAVDPALPTAKFRRQHLELFTLSNALVEWREPDSIATNAAEVVRRLARFVGFLQVHAAMEEEALYPRLLRDDDATIRQQARDLLDGVAPIYKEVFAYGEKWRRSDAVSADPQGYLKDTKAVLRRLTERVTRETMELYSLVDAKGL